MLGREDLGLGGKEGEIAAAVCPGNSTHGVFDGCHMMGGRCAADVDGRTDFVMADAWNLGEHGQLLAVGIPGRGTFSTTRGNGTGDEPETGAPPGAAGAVGIHDVEAGFIGLLDVSDVVERVRGPWVGADGKAPSIGRGRDRSDAARQHDDRGRSCGGLAVLDGEDGELALMIDFPCTVEALAIARESHGREVGRQFELGFTAAVGVGCPPVRMCGSLLSAIGDAIENDALRRDRGSAGAMENGPVPGGKRRFCGDGLAECNAGNAHQSAQCCAPLPHPSRSHS